MQSSFLYVQIKLVFYKTHSSFDFFQSSIQFVFMFLFLHVGLLQLQERGQSKLGYSHKGYSWNDITCRFLKWCNMTQYCKASQEGFWKGWLQELASPEISKCCSLSSIFTLFWLPLLSLSASKYFSLLKVISFSVSFSCFLFYLLCFSVSSDWPSMHPACPSFCITLWFTGLIETH